MSATPKNVIISIKPEYAFKIMSGDKTIELRRKFPVKDIEGGIAIIYASSPVREIIGYAVIEKVHELPLDTLWRKYRKHACVSKTFFYEYFTGLNHGFALSLSQPTQLIEPLDIKRMEEEFFVTAPQSFRYAPDKVLNCVAA